MSRSYSSATNSDHMRNSNRLLLTNIVRRKPVSRAELARITGLTRAAVTIIVSGLIKDGVLFETGSADADFGRKPVLLDLVPSGYYAIGVSITREGCNVGIMNIKGVLLHKSAVDLERTADPIGMIRMIAESVRMLLKKVSIPNERVLVIGLNAPGPVDAVRGSILNPPNFSQWNNVDIVKEFSEYFDFPVLLENNSISLAIAEKNYGRGAELRNFMLMVVDSGIGAGIVINDKIYRGAYGFGNEVGHTSIDFRGELCQCGNRGCLEIYASIPAVIKDIHSRGISITTWKEIVDRALKGDSICTETIEQEAIYLSAGIVNTMNILDLEAVVLTGDIGYKPKMLLKSVRDIVWRSGITRKINKLIIVSSSINEDSGVISAASIIFERFFRGEI